MSIAVADSNNSTLSARPTWHAEPHQAVVEAFATHLDGLDTAEASSRLASIGPNELPAPPRVHPVLRFLRQFNNSLIYFLLAAGVAAAVLEHMVDAAVIVIVVVVNALVGFVQEGRAERALDAIRDMIAPQATVLRDGERHVVDAREIVPGDIVAVEAGDKVPADMRIVHACRLLADEAILTGESVPAEKREEPVAADAPLGDRFCMLYSGTLVATGQALGVVVATGAGTEIGGISTMIGRVRPLTTPLLQQIDKFGRLLTWFALVIAAAVFVFATLVRAYPWVDALMVVVALAVGVVPEGLPAVITITLAVGVQRMAARNAVVRRLPAVETLGATSVICSDKTGTLTRNEMTARRIATVSGESIVSGSGYAPEGSIRIDGAKAPSDEARDGLLLAALLCNDAEIVEKHGQWSVVGDPMEGALVTLAIKAGFHVETARELWKRVDEIPFDAQHRFMATLNESPSGERRIFVKGAPERVIGMCGAQALDGLTMPLDLEYWIGTVAEAAGRGERVLAFAAKEAGADSERLSFEAVEAGDLVLLGVVGLIDPPRDEAMDAVASCRSAGIAIKMITGDHAGTAATIARQLIIDGDPVAVEGREIDAITDEALREVVSRVSVFARTTPEHKIRIVRALQANGHIVAMTGDGVNDAPALKQADVGVAMGRKGTEAAKEAAEMVLVDDNFASIVAAVQEGRTVYDNIRKVIAWTLPTNGGEMLCVIIAIAFGLALPMTAIQMLWINLVLEVTLGLVLAFEPSEPDTMRRPPRKRDEPILSRFLVWRVVLVSLLFTAGVFVIFEYAIRQGLGEDVARTMVVNTIVVMEIFYLFNVRYMHMTSFSLIGAMGTRAVLLAIAAVVTAQLAFTYAPFMQALFGTAPIALKDGLPIIGIGILLMVILEVEKAAMRRFMPLVQIAP
ncbi:MAG: HAD-IC family P-type ATPase [Mesorhizobium sp.]|nr:HAD-IC family P-type ATPase [Mesorhizobium sp.]MCO5160786.1 HAD-IC family P-type ATPase [Mesorhizobium sp.]